MKCDNHDLTNERCEYTSRYEITPISTKGTAAAPYFSCRFHLEEMIQSALEFYLDADKVTVEYSGYG